MQYTRLVTFGDSWTAGHGVETELKYKEVIDCGLFINTLRNSNGWPRYLAEHMDVPFVNLGVCNLGNPEIIEKIRTYKQFLRKKDLIIVMLSYAYRAGGDPTVDINTINEELSGYNYYILNSFYPTFLNVPESLMEGINLDRFLWHQHPLSIVLEEYEQIHDVSVWEYGFRKVGERKDAFLGGDFHPNTLGYKVLGEKIFDIIPELKKQ